MPTFSEPALARSRVRSGLVAHSRVRFTLPFALAVLLVLPALSANAHEDVDPALARPAAPAADALPLVVSGTVIDLVVEDRVSNKTQRYVALRLTDGTGIALVGPGLESLPAGARAEAVGRNAGDTLFVTDAHVLAQAPTPSLREKQAASKTQVEGTLTLFHKDYFAQERAEYRFGVHEVHNGAAQMTPLNLAVVPDVLRVGMTVSVSGTTAADGVSLDTTQITILGMPQQQTVLGGVSITNNVLVMPIKFADSPAGDPFTPAQVDQVMRTNANSVAAYYNEVSYGQQQLNITVACATTSPSGCAANTAPGGWLRSSSATPANCNYTTIANLADQAATAAGYNVANYNNRFYVLPSLPCGWAGLAYIGYPYQAFSDGYNALWVYGHELGHNFTLYHAGSVNCSPQTLGGSCSASEYGDRFDIMGNNSNPGEQMHFNAEQKSVLNWIPASSVVTHSGGTATYTLSPLEAGGQSTYAVKIPITADANRTYWIEYRQPIGFDSGLAAYPNNGAQIRVASPFEWSSGADDTEILDMTPGTPGNFYDAALLVGQNYTDSTYGISVTVNSASASALSVTVSTGGGKVASTTTLASSANPSLLGASVTFTATVSGSAPTGTVNFKDGATSIASCGAVALSGSGNARSAACSTTSLAGGTHSITAVYSGDGANNSSTSAVLSQVVNKATSTTGIATSLTPSAPGTTVTFTATVSAAAPTGTVNFNDGASSIAGCSAAVVTGSGNVRTAQCATSALTVGTHSITAVYSGDATNNGSTSSVLSQVVNGAASTTSIGTTLNPSTAGTSVTFTATVTATAPTGTVNFKDGANSISGCATVALAGSGNVRTAQCATGALSVGTHSITAVYSGDANNAGSTSSTLSQVVNSSSGTSINVALASNGGVALASSTSDSNYPVSAVINGDRAGLNFGAGGVWKDGTPYVFPDWVEIDFSGPQTIDHVIVYSVQDNYSNPVDPSDTLTFTRRGLTAFDVQAWNGSAWVTLGSVTGNNLVKRTVSFAATSTSKIRVLINASANGYSFLAEIEAWTGVGAAGR
jgi:hypothetical protein